MTESSRIKQMQNHLCSLVLWSCRISPIMVSKVGQRGFVCYPVLGQRGFLHASRTMEREREYHSLAVSSNRFHQILTQSPSALINFLSVQRLGEDT